MQKFHFRWGSPASFRRHLVGKTLRYFYCDITLIRFVSKLIDHTNIFLNQLIQFFE